ncbi:MAG: dihydrofolate reductase [Bacteroidales bacterium]|jgi:dipeptidyl-peptidase-3|nr:dihydrofolate reductase [Bacteroidales bacterium]
MTDFKILTEQFADIRILRYKVPGFENLSFEKKRLIYFFSQAALWGRDIIYDQNYKYNLLIRYNLENVLKTYKGKREDEPYKQFLIYIKRFWFSNGIHHHYSMDKFFPDCTINEFKSLLKNSDISGFKLFGTESINDFIEEFTHLIFNPTIDAKRLSLNTESDLVFNSACNFYENISQKDAEEFYINQNVPDSGKPISLGLNSKLIKENGQIKELTYKLGGHYSSTISKMIFWLEKAVRFTENKAQQQALQKLIDFYKSGDLKEFDDYCLLWLKDTLSTVDIIHGFIETYGDPLGRKATYEAIVSIRDEESTKRAETISKNADWFEQNSFTSPKHKKEKIKGVTAKAIFAVMEAGDCSPSTPIGVNLPNADWIRAEHGSKSVSISNIIDAYQLASKDSGVLEEFAYSKEEIKLDRLFGNNASKLHVDLHEIIGHGSGKLEKGVSEPNESLKNYASTIEEARADLVALYYATDQKLIELGLMPDEKTGICEYNSFIRSSLLTQLVRVELGKDIEESHMRNRQLIANWVFDQGKSENVIERVKRNGNTYFVIHDYDKLRLLFGNLLKEVQRIKSTGDYKAAKHLVENFGVKVDTELHKEVLERWKKLSIAPHSGFINPEYTPIFEDHKMVDINITYPNNFTEQMLSYSQYYSSLI